MAAVTEAVETVGKHNVLLRAGEGDVEQTPFFLQILSTRHHVDGREKILFQADDKNVWEFEALGGMDGHKSDAVGVVFLGRDIHVR